MASKRTASRSVELGRLGCLRFASGICPPCSRFTRVDASSLSFSLVTPLRSHPGNDPGRAWRTQPTRLGQLLALHFRSLLFTEWTKVLGSERFTGTLLDRLTHLPPRQRSSSWRRAQAVSQEVLEMSDRQVPDSLFSM